MSERRHSVGQSGELFCLTLNYFIILLLVLQLNKVNVNK